MKKADDLRAHLVRHLPDLARDPERLRIFTEKARVRPTQAPAPHFLLEYDLQLVIIDMSYNVLAVFILINEWLRRYQPDVIASHKAAGYNFEAEIMTNSTADLMITLPLTEVIHTERREGGGWDMFAMDDDTSVLADFLGIEDLVPTADGGPLPTLKEIYWRGEKLLPDDE